MRSIANISFRGAAIAALLFVSCVSGGHGTDPNKTNPDWGWRSAGLTASGIDVSNNAGYQAILHVGKRIFVMDARTLQGNQACRIFSSKQGTETWDSLNIPNGLVPNAWIADSPYVYVGMSSKGAIWRYNVNNSTWDDLKTGADSIYSVSGFGHFNGGVIASLASSQTAMRPILYYKDSSWINLNQSAQFPDDASFLSGIEYHGTFYAATYDTGVWAWTPSDSMWRKLQNPVSPYDTTIHDRKFPRSMAVLNDSLYMGYYSNGGIQKLVNGNSWVRMDSCITYMYNGSPQYSCGAPSNAYTMAIWNNHLIASGDWSSIPVVYMAPSQPKGWALLGGDTWKGGMNSTFDMTVVGDTLYTASWNAVWKFPLSQLDSSVKAYPAYPGYPSSSSAATTKKTIHP